VLGDRRKMGFGAIAKMLAETIGGIKTADAAHQAVAGHLGDDGAAAIEGDQSIALDDRLGGTRRSGGKSLPSIQHIMGAAESAKSARRIAKKRRLADID